MQQLTLSHSDSAKKELSQNFFQIFSHSKWISVLSIENSSQRLTHSTLLVLFFSQLLNEQQSEERIMTAGTASGRIRFRNEALKVAEFGMTVRDALLEAKGVLEVQVNRRIGSLLVIFDKSRINAEKILTRIADALGVDLDKMKKQAQQLQRTISGRDARKYVKRGLLASLGLALGVVFLSEEWHVAAGTAFVGLLAAHLYQNRRTLMR